MSGNKWYHHKYFLSGYLNEELGEKEVALVEDCGQSGRICRYVKHWSWSEKLVLQNKQNWKLLLFDARSTFTTTECGGDFGGPLLQVDCHVLVLVLGTTGAGGFSSFSSADLPLNTRHLDTALFSLYNRMGKLQRKFSTVKRGVPNKSANFLKKIFEC